MTHRLDIGPSDVHIPGAVGAQKVQMAKPSRAKRKTLTKKRPRKPVTLGSTGLFKIHLTAPDGSRTVIRHRLGQTTASYDDATDRLCLSFDIDKAEALAEGDEKKRVWVQIARTGAWAGHPQGAFQITEATLDTIVANFYGQGFGRIQWDFDHYSAMPANSGNIPQTGKPAQGWAYEMRREGSKLYALTEWLPLAREYIKNDQYGGVSPVINWKGTDRASGKPIGPIITSIALTNLPFILGMEKPMAASADGLPDETNRGLTPLTEVSMPGDNPEQSELSASACKCFGADELIPQLKQIFGLHPLATAQQCSEVVSNLRTHLTAVGGNGSAVHQGVDLSLYTMPLRAMTNAHAGMDWFAILDIIDELLDAYLDQHGLPDFEETHGPIPTEATAVQATSAPAETTASAALVEVTPADPAPEAQPEAVTEASAAPLPDAEVSALTLQNADLAGRLAKLEAEKLALEAENAALKKQEELANISALAAEVEDAFVTYKDAKGLTEESRPHMLSMLKAEPDAFRALYPPVDADKRHLLLNLTGARVEADVAPEVPATTQEELQEKFKAEVSVLSLGITGLSKQLIAESGNKLTVGAAQLIAEKKIRDARKSVSAK